MKIKTDGSFSWPVLQHGREEYVADKEFSFTIDCNTSKKNEIEFQLTWSCNSDFINGLISKMQAKVILHIESKTYRNAFDVFNNTQSISIPKSLLGEGYKVEILPMVVTTKEINFNYNHDFDDEYTVVESFNVPKGGILAIGESSEIDISLTSNKIKNIFVMKLDENMEELYKIDVNGGTINVIASPQIYMPYTRIGKTTPFYSAFIAKQALDAAMMRLLSDSELNEDSRLLWVDVLLSKLADGDENFDIEDARESVKVNGEVSIQELQTKVNGYSTKILKAMIIKAVTDAEGKGESNE